LDYGICFLTQCFAEFLLFQALASGQPSGCLLVQVGSGGSYDDNFGWRCVDERGIDHALSGLPPGFIRNNKADFISTVSTLSISSATKTPAGPGQQNTITANPGALVSFVARGGSRSNRRFLRNRNLQQTPETVQQKLTGAPSLLAVRVTFTDASPARVAWKISNDFFGTAGSEVHMVSKTSTPLR
jgi:hypothetical protein